VGADAKFLPNFCQFGSSNRELNGTGQERTVLTCSVLFSSWFWLEVVSSVLSSHKEAKNRTELNFGNTTTQAISATQNSTSSTHLVIITEYSSMSNANCFEIKPPVLKFFVRTRK
jgi:hypothetical protein